MNAQQLLIARERFDRWKPVVPLQGDFEDYFGPAAQCRLNACVLCGTAQREDEPHTLHVHATDFVRINKARHFAFCSAQCLYAWLDAMPRGEAHFLPFTDDGEDGFHHGDVHPLCVTFVHSRGILHHEHPLVMLHPASDARLAVFIGDIAMQMYLTDPAAFNAWWASRTAAGVLETYDAAAIREQIQRHAA